MSFSEDSFATEGTTPVRSRKDFSWVSRSLNGLARMGISKDKTSVRLGTFLDGHGVRCHPDNLIMPSKGMAAVR